MSDTTSPGELSPARLDDSPAAPRRALSLLDAMSIMVGIVIGSGIYESTPIIASCLPASGALLGAWALGGLYTLLGAWCYAEMATSSPHAGGDYRFLVRAWGPGLGILFAWVQLWVVRPGSIGAFAVLFGQHAARILGAGPAAASGLAAGAIIVLAAINAWGVRFGTWTQNLFTSAKVAGLAAVMLIGWTSTSEAVGASVAPPADGAVFDLRLAMILVLFCYGGWNEMPYVAAEVREPRKNLHRALVLGTLAITAIYLLFNGALLHALGVQGIAAGNVAARVVELRWGALGGALVNALICISALGAMNGMTFTGSRIYYAVGRDHRALAPLGRWHPRRGTPVVAIVVEAAITSALLAGLTLCYGPEQRVFDKLILFTGPFYWAGLVLAGLSLFRLRRREASGEHPFRVPGYPFVPGLFVAGAAWMTYAAVDWAWLNWSWEGWWAVAVTLSGIGLAWKLGRSADPAAMAT